VQVVLSLQLLQVTLDGVERGKAKVLFDLLEGRGDAPISDETFDELEHVFFFFCEGAWCFCHRDCSPTYTKLCVS